MSDQPQKPELTDEQYEELLKDPEFVRKLNETPRAKEMTEPASPEARPWPLGRSWVGDALLRWGAVIFAWVLLKSIQYQMAPAPLGELKEIYQSLGVRRGEGILETFFMNLAAPNHYQVYLLTLVVCFLAIHPKKLVSRIAFWVGLPLAAAPGGIKALAASPFPDPWLYVARYLVLIWVCVWAAYSLVDWLMKTPVLNRFSKNENHVP